MKQRGRRNTQSYIPKQWRSAIIFFLVILVGFFIFSTINTLQRIFLQEKSIDILTDNLHTLSIQARAVDEDIADFLLALDTLLDDYFQGKDIFVTQPHNIDYIRGYIANNSDKLQQRGFQDYKKIIDIFTDIYPHKEEIYQLLGKQQPQNYLAILQNTSEKRPNGGFFGSFAFAQITHGMIEKLGVVDSYLPDFLAPTTTITAPKWAQPMLEEPIIRFIASNKFGFTDLDGKIIKNLYEKVFNETYDKKKFQQSQYNELEQTLVHKNINGIIFLSTEMFEHSTPSITPLLQKRQFINANIDLIRGENRSHKKEIYLQEVNQYFKKNSVNLTLNIFRDFDYITQHHLLNIYLPHASPALQDLLERHNLTTIYDSGHIYIRDTNHAFNKIDKFVYKEIIITNDVTGVSHYYNQDVIDIHNLQAGNYTISINYQLNIPHNYIQYIRSLETQYNITMTPRELGILGLGPTYDNLYRANQTTIHIPSKWIIRKIQGDIVNESLQKLISPFSQIINFRSEMTSSNQYRNITINVTIE